MKSAFAIVALLAVIGIGAFGFLGMIHMGGNHTLCAAQLKTFSLAVLQSSDMHTFLFSMLALCVAFFFAIRKNMPALQPALFARSSGFFKFLFFPIQQELARWLAFHTNSPAFF